MTVPDVVIQQLLEIQNTLGGIASTVEGLKEDVRTNSTETSSYRETITSGLNNALGRIGALETEIKIIKQTIEKTLGPMINDKTNWRQRLIGFLSAWSLFAAIIGLLVSGIIGFWDQISRLIRFVIP